MLNSAEKNVMYTSSSWLRQQYAQALRQPHRRNMARARPLPHSDFVQPCQNVIRAPESGMNQSPRHRDGRTTRASLGLENFW